MKSSRKSSKRRSRKASRKTSRKASRKTSRRRSKKMEQEGGGECKPCPPCKDGKKKKRAAPAHSKLQTKVIKMIAEKEGVNYRDAIKRLKPNVNKAIGKSWDEVKKTGKMTWMEALEATQKMLKN